MLKQSVMGRRTIRYTICGLDYVYLKYVPVKKTRHGEVLDADPAVIEREIATEIVRQGIPIRGAEVKFLRKSLGLSMERFGMLLGLSPPAILKWEREPQKRLHPTNEVAVRALMAEKLNIVLEGKFTVLKGRAVSPERLELTGH
jgi:DNA-binding transcriptional regulator YiaG